MVMHPCALTVLVRDWRRSKYVDVTITHRETAVKNVSHSTIINPGKDLLHMRHTSVRVSTVGGAKYYEM